MKNQRGSAMLITLILIAAMLGGAAVLAGIQLASTRSSDLTRIGTQSTYCAEAGLAIARPIVLNNYPAWAAAIAASGASLNAGTVPVESAFLATGITAAQHDIDGDGIADFYVYLKDNDDEFTIPNDRTVDADLKVFIVSRCIKYPDQIREVEELVSFTGGGTCYQSQLGGCGGNNNSN